MKTTALVLLALLAVVGCQARPKSAAVPPQIIEELTNQTMIYSCPKCGMDFDAAGECSMCHVALVQTKVQYICPTDNNPVEHTGRCPRCEANAKVVRTAMAEKTGGS